MPEPRSQHLAAPPRTAPRPPRPRTASPHHRPRGPRPATLSRRGSLTGAAPHAPPRELSSRGRRSITQPPLRRPSASRLSKIRDGTSYSLSEYVALLAAVRNATTGMLALLVCAHANTQHSLAGFSNAERTCRSRRMSEGWTLATLMRIHTSYGSSKKLRAS